MEYVHDVRTCVHVDVCMYVCLFVGDMSMNGHMSPEAHTDQTDGGGEGEDEVPPPIPIKKRHM